MSSESIDNVHEWLRYISPTVGIKPLGDKQKEREESKLILKKEKKGVPSASLRQCSFLPTKLCALFQDSQNMLLLLELFGTTSKVCTILGTTEAAPYLGILAAPTYLYHATSKAYKRFNLMIDAFKVGKIADGFFWGGRGIDAMGSAISNTGKSISGSCQLLGLSSLAIFGLIFAFILPVLSIITGAIGGTALTCALWRNSQALKNFNEKYNDQNIKALVDTLEYLQGPKQQLEKEDKDTDRAAHKTRLFNLEKENFITSHFSKEERHDEIQKKLEKIQLRIKCQKTELQEVTGWNELFAVYKDFEIFFENILKTKEGDEFRVIDDMITLYDKLLELPKLNETVRGMLEQNKKELSKLMIEGKEAATLSKSDIERTICTNSLSLFITLILLTEGALVLAFPQHALIGTYLLIGTSVLNVSMVLFDKKISLQEFHRLRMALSS